MFARLTDWLTDVEETMGGRYASDVYVGSVPRHLKATSVVSHPILFVAYAGVLLLIANKRNDRVALIAGTSAFLGTLCINLVLKRVFRRSRPLTGRYVTPLPYDNYSFPSAHSAVSFSLAVALGIIDRDLVLPGLLWASVMASSRVLSKVHEPIDIFVGIVEGVFLGTLIGIIARRSR